ncbi:hypothetical protein [Brucella haematophila]|uniref:DUF4376 domain-containing protein n=1 Tax=Brucella haematophila TaxID=419474 RepID=A0ABX1DRX0_9HYPH|nr:hypothetical protein [Brucella haematophila]NKC04297.1 hypothetical protein [Brucella haematophila]TMV06148.1 hypothetical protein FGI60_02225 [Brucella haematophila]
MKYSASTRGFYKDTALNAPADAVSVSDEDYAALFEGQSSGLEIVPDEKGYPVLADTPDLSLMELQANLKRDIDSKAEIERLKYITPGAGQAMTYQQKVAEARAFKAETDPNATEYPLMLSEVGITAPTINGVADVVLAAYAQWQQIGGAIEAIRLAAKRDIDTTTDKAAARAIVDATVWPSEQVQA